MHGLLLILALGLSPADDGVADRVRALVEQLREDDIDAVDRAGAKLFRLGPDALEPLREQARLRGGDVHLRILGIISGIEREQRLRVALGSPPVVTLKAEDRPLKEVMEELSRQAGIPVEGVELSEDLRVSLDVERELLWDAVNRLCRDYGNLMFTFTPRRVLLREAPYRRVPHASRKGFFFLVDSMTWNKSFHQGVSRSYFNMQTAVIVPPGAMPVSARMEIEDFRDDQGTELAQQGSSGRWSGSGARSGPRSLLIPLHHGSSLPPAEDATRIERFKGRVVLTFALRMNRILSIENPEEPPGRVATGQGHTLLLKRARRSGKTLRLDIDVTRSWTPAETRRLHEIHGSPSWRVVIRDDRGKELEGRVQHRGSRASSGASGRIETRSLTVAFTLEEGTAAAALDLIRPEEFEEITLPFDFRKLPFGEKE